MFTIQTELGRIHKTRLPIQFRSTLLLFGFSIIYFADVFIRASEKYFWYDELFTVYLCRLPSQLLWQSLKAGIDLNPPLFFLFTKASHALFGEGLVATRLPQMFGFWIFCVCLFQFVSRRVGQLAAFTAMTIPMFTGAFYYAYEARAYGLVLGFCGLALVCWQMSLDRPQGKIWLVGVSLALFAACMTHYYAPVIAIPFGIAELVHAVQCRRIEWHRWLAILAPGLACLTYVPLIPAFRSAVRGTILPGTRPLPSQIPAFYAFLLEPSILIFVLSLLVLAVNLLTVFRSPVPVEACRVRIGTPELVLAASFLGLPVFGLILGVLLKSPFIDRYFLSAVAGLCVLIGLGIGVRKERNLAPIAFAVIMAWSLLWNFSALLWRRVHGIPEALAEPSSGFAMNSSLAGPLDRYSLLLSEVRHQQSIVVMWPIEFIYLVNYAPNLRPQLYYISWNDTDFFYRTFERFQRWSPVQYNIMTAQAFFRVTPEFAFFGSEHDVQLHVLAGGGIKSVQFSNGRFLAEVSQTRHTR